MLVGEGRAGKTAVANAFMGVPFVHTESTCGINQFSVGVAHAVVGSGWHPCEAAASELDAAIIALAKAKHDRPQPKASRRDDGLRAAGPAKDSVIMDGGDADVAGPLEFESFLNLKTEQYRAALLNDNLFSGSDLVVQLFDFAGQDVFSCLHSYFLTRHGVYVIVFDMNWLSSTSSDLQGALEYLAFWMNSVAMNTRTDDKTFAPIFLVGTHKDQISDAAEHTRISTLLDVTFKYSAAWASVVEDGDSRLVYFPVNCTLGVQDPTISRLMSRIEESVRTSSYISIKRPLPWYDAMDTLRKQTSPTISSANVTATALKCSVSPERIHELLEFLRDMGVIMWYDEPGLRDLVILDPVKYFVKSVTRVICQPELHSSEVHRVCKKNKREAYDLLFSTGLASQDILHELLGYDGHCVKALTALMLKYGLATCWSKDVRGSAVSVAANKYLVPSLFPEMSSSPTAKKWVDDEKVLSCYFVFSLDKSLGIHALKESELSGTGFLPKGLFDRLLCTALEWCRDSAVSDSVLSEFSLCKSFAILQALGIWFRMTSIPKYHCIRVDTIEKTDHYFSETIVAELLQRWKAAINTRFRDLQMATFIPFISHFGHHSLLVPSFISNTVAGVENLVHLDRVSVRYHCFLSYRWDAFDKAFVTALHDHLVRLIVRGRRMRVFFDTSVIQTADSIQQKFFISILSTEIFFPVVSPNALVRMITHEPQSEDNLLIEWLTVLVLVKYAPINGLPNRLPRFICPICFSGPDDDGYFAIRARLSDAVPVATIRKVKELFDLVKIVLSADMMQRLAGMTVKNIVDGIMEYYCLGMAVTDDIPVAVRKCCIEAMKLFFRADGILAPAEYLQEMREL
jgi:GTPase SAR1 family protein